MEAASASYYTCIKVKPFARVDKEETIVVVMVNGVVCVGDITSVYMELSHLEQTHKKLDMYLQQQYSWITYSLRHHTHTHTHTHTHNAVTSSSLLPLMYSWSLLYMSHMFISSVQV